MSLMKNSQENFNFTAFFKMSTYVMSNTYMLKIRGIHSISSQSVSIMTCILNQIFFCLLMYLRISGNTCLYDYKLDPCHNFTSPGLSCDAVLKMTDIKLELMTDIDMFQFVDNGI